jgi:acetoin utilization deacetylase AcuC-like enzyme
VPDLAASIRRHWRRLRRLGRPRAVDFVYSPDYELHLPGMLHDPQRGERILTFLAAEGLVRESAVHAPRPASLQEIARVHTAEYLDSLRDAAALARLLGFSVPEEVADRILDLQRLMAGGTQLATRLALAGGGVAVNLGGGFHHAFSDHGARFCVFNDIAVAIAGARRRGFDGPVLVIDLDLHDGDGTREIFAADETVHTFSIHNLTSAPLEAVAATVIELPGGTGDREYLEVLRRRLPPVFATVAPELVFYLAGADPAADDALGNFELTPEGVLERDRFVVGIAGAGPEPAARGDGGGAEGAAGADGGGEDGAPAGGPLPPDRLPALAGRVPLVIALAGGYGQEAWRYGARFCAWLASGQVIEPPSTDDITLARYRRIARRFQPSDLTTEETGDDDGFGLSEADILGDLGGAPRRTRLLGYYSPHGVELALERTGIFDRLRALGFDPRIELDFDSPGGEMLRVYGGPGRDEMLLELRCAVDASSLPGFDLLRVEWLLIQNPRRRFAPDQPALPGQKHPGLGLLRDAVSLLILVCDRLGLDGLYFVPSHFHLAAQSRKYLRFVEPEHEARFRAICGALEGLPLGEATRAVAAGRVRDAEGDAVEWEPVPMVLATTERLERKVRGEDYEAALAEATARYRYRLSGEGGERA